MYKIRLMRKTWKDMRRFDKRGFLARFFLFLCLWQMHSILEERWKKKIVERKIYYPWQRWEGNLGQEDLIKS